jgi:hypothetical protein
MHTFKWKWSIEQPHVNGLDEFLSIWLTWVEVHSGLGISSVVVHLGFKKKHSCHLYENLGKGRYSWFNSKPKVYVVIGVAIVFNFFERFHGLDDHTCCQ